jgi:hypothetical protein
MLEYFSIDLAVIRNESARFLNSRELNYLVNAPMARLCASTEWVSP